LIAAGVAGFGVGCVVGWAHIGDGTVAWGTFGEWIGGLGAALAVLWAVYAFRQEREGTERRYAELVTVLKPEWRPPGAQGSLRAYVLIQNGGPVDIDRVVVSAEVDGVQTSVAQLFHGNHRIWPGGKKGYELSWDPPVREQRAIRPTVVFQDVALKWWSHALDEPPKRLSGPPREVLQALAEADARGEG
jgi:hypothetical protein